MQKRRKKRGRPKGLPPLDERHYRAIDIMSDRRDKTLEDVARELNIDRRTLYRWRERADFQRILQREIKRKLRARFPRKRDASYYVNPEAKTMEMLLRINELM